MKGSLPPAAWLQPPAAGRATNACPTAAQPRGPHEILRARGENLWGLFQESPNEAGEAASRSRAAPCCHGVTSMSECNNAEPRCGVIARGGTGARRGHSTPARCQQPGLGAARRPVSGGAMPCAGAALPRPQGEANGIHAELGGIKPWRWDRIPEASPPLLSGCGVGSDLWARGTDGCRSGDEGDAGSLPLQLQETTPGAHFWAGRVLTSRQHSQNNGPGPCGTPRGAASRRSGRSWHPQEQRPPLSRVSPSTCTRRTCSVAGSAGEARSPRSSSLPAQRSQCPSISAAGVPRAPGHHRCPRGLTCAPRGFGRGSALGRHSCCRTRPCHGAGAPPAPPSGP